MLASAASYRAAVPVFAALGDPHRWLLVRRLCTDGDATLTQLSVGLEISRQAVSKHLQVLARAGLASSKARGRERVWKCKRARLDDAQQALAAISREWDLRLGRLAQLVEDRAELKAP